ncbi:DUF305 domain-containing protein [Catellatospora methionotrophica]|uniref:DUF305 domain-containing protein n=1 Tax=Catellatospora methionotrophica TaxID=121620 RepID=A0A8J3PHF4_9ACTN|nr:DUF305 domain-containing protein [Catellatospora methionotrophica]GIG16368.1 DUF305 domain-containing protein [Catellatospora methionotrophica]
MRRIGFALAAAALTLLAACGTAAPEPVAYQPPGPPRADATFNATDVMFLQMMVTHHTQGLEMVKLARTRQTSEEVAMLAGAIEVTQTTELEVMRGWLNSWGEPVSAGHDPNAHASHGGLPITGADEMAALRAATGARFQTTFLNLLIGHQHNAVEMARTETDGGANPQVKDLANRITLSRDEQIKQMLALVAA